MNESALSRDKQIIKTSAVGIVVNVLLSAFKAFIGVATNSIAITLDAVNNISDAASSTITIVGTKLAAKRPDKKHPFGYGRIEYMSAMIISILVLYAGITAFTESVKKIITPETPDYSTAALIIVAVGVLVKFLLGRYVKAVGKRVNSDALVNSGSDASLDSVISASTLVAAGVYLIWQISLEAYLGAVIALVIIKAGLEMLRDTISRLLGERADASLANEIKKTITSYPEISGAYDLFLHDYGPDKYQGSVHIEVPDTYTANELDNLIRTVTLDVLGKHRVLLTAIGVYSINTRDPKAVELRESIAELVLAQEYVRQMHGFYLDEANKKIRFDLVVSFDAPDMREVYKNVSALVHERYPDYEFAIAMDVDMTEE